MKFDFSAQFLKIVHPDTSFGKAWESLCFELLNIEFQDISLIKLEPPDCGVDIIYRKNKTAYQCKSDERGAFGALSSDSSVMYSNYLDSVMYRK